MSDEELEAVDASEERPVDGDRFIRVRRATLETVIGLLASHAEQRRESTKVVEEIRRRIALEGHPAGGSSADE